MARQEMPVASLALPGYYCKDGRRCRWMPKTLLQESEVLTLLKKYKKS